MNIVFIRHGHAEHLLHYPNHLDRKHPSLTLKGKRQLLVKRRSIQRLKIQLFVVSPTKRTIQSACLVTTPKNMLISPLVGPHMFPNLNSLPSYGCDQAYSLPEINYKYKTLQKDKTFYEDHHLLWNRGINRLDGNLYKRSLNRFLSKLALKYHTIAIVSHDGTITSIRECLGEAGVYQLRYR